jgi:hypothetical protein
VHPAAGARARGLASERSGPNATAHGQGLAACPTRPEQKAAAAAGRSWRRQLGVEGGGGSWEPGSKIRVAGKEENVSGSHCGGRGRNFGGKLMETHFHYFLVSCLRRVSGSFWVLQSLVFVCASGFLG